MKRMVENSEKIEKLIDNVDVNDDDIYFNKKVILDYGFYSGGGSQFDSEAVFNDKLITQNITTPGGISFKLINEEDYSITDSGLNMSISTINLGVAIAVTAQINVSESNGEYTIISFNNNKLNNLSIIQMSGDPVCNVIKNIDSSNNKTVIKVNLNKNAAEYPVADYYRFSFILGILGKEI